MFRNLCIPALIALLSASCTTEGDTIVDDTGVDSATDTGAFIGGTDTRYTKDTGVKPTDTTTQDAVNGDDPYAADRQACVDEINRHRATEGKSPLGRWTGAELCSDGEAKSDSETNIPHGAFGQCGEFGQNECPGWPSTGSIVSGCLQAMWDEGPPGENPCEGQCFQDHGHYINMSSTRFTQVACSFYTTPSGDVWSVQNFK